MKRSSYFKLGMAAILLGTSITACKKDSPATVTTSSEVAFDVTSDNSASVIASVNGPAIQSVTTLVPANNLVWTSGVANISSFKLEAKKNGVETEISTKNITIDLFAITPATIAAKIDTGTYKEIEIRAVLVKSSGADIPLKLNGTFTTPGGAVVPIEFDYNDDAIIKLEAENVTVDGTQNIAAHLGMHLNKLLSGISPADLDKATRTNGELIISSTSNIAIYNRVRLNILLAFIAKGWEKHHK